ncbi:MAG: deiodinase family protein [Planctomycetaceae bacterium]
MTIRKSLAAAVDCVARPFSMRPVSVETQLGTDTLAAFVIVADVLKLILLVSLVTAFAAATVADERTDPPAIPVSEQQAERPDDELTPEAQQAAADLMAQLPEDSEARAMLDSILDGSQLGPGEGWFATAVSQTLFGWDHVVQSCDADHDETVTAEEFGGTADDFERIDRNGDHILTEADFDWSLHSLERTPGVMLFFQADRDANGKLTKQEIVSMFESLDSDARGFVSLDELRDQFQPPDEQQQQERRASRSDRPSRSTLVLGLQRQEIGSLSPGPDVGNAAPDFTLKRIDHGDDVTLSQEIGEQPIVLIFGNFTCGPFRSQAGNIEKLYERYRNRAKFFLVYVREAHPTDGWNMNSNQRVGIEIAQPAEQQQRMKVAQTCQQHLDLDLPFLVDTIDDQAGTAYSGMPNRLYLIDRDGRIVFKNGRGPFGFHPRQLEQALLLLLNNRQQTRSGN